MQLKRWSLYIASCITHTDVFDSWTQETDQNSSRPQTKNGLRFKRCSLNRAEPWDVKN